jgi:hypothetical protein
VHEAAIDWLELNVKATHLLFRDRGARLHLACLATGTRSQLLQAASYAQWVPDSDVIVVRLCSRLSKHAALCLLGSRIRAQVHANPSRIA